MVKLSDIEYQAILDNEKRAVNELTRMRAELAEARKDGERLAACVTRVHAIASRQLAEPANISDSVALVRICTEIEAARGTK